MDLKKAENIKKRWQEYTKELYKKDLHDPDNHNAVITQLEPDILDCKGKWGLGSITMKKASGGDGISTELFQILKDDAVKILHSICQQTRVPTLTILIQHSFRSPTHSNQRGKINLKNSDWKRMSKTLTLYR